MDFILFFYYIFISPPLAAEVEGAANEERRVSRDSIAQPEPQVAHVEGYAEEQRQPDPYDQSVQDGYGEVDYVVAGAVGKSV